MEAKEIGKVEHYFGKIGVAAIRITSGPLNVGDTIHVKGHTTNLTQKVDSMQAENKSVQKANNGDGIGIKVKAHVRDNDVIYKVIE